MKFKVREGFVVKLQNKVEIEDGKFQIQEVNHYGNQIADLTAEQALEHAHKLEPKDDKAAAFLEGRHSVATPPVVAPISAEVQALAKAMAAEMVGAIMAAQQSAAASNTKTA
jgi:hypothetical protein